MLNRTLIFKITLAMIAFAANSVLCRLALKGGHIDPFTFSNLRLISGAIALLPLLVRRRGMNASYWNLKNSLFLMLYAVCFSVAYIGLDTGTGALLLFGAVQLTMIIYGLFKGEKINLARGTGIMLALAGMIVLLLPGAKAPSPNSAFLMVISGFAWGIYSIAGKKASQAGISTAANFVLAAPMAIILIFFFSGQYSEFDTIGVVLAIVSGAVTSAGAYVLWYSLLPQLESVTASTIQLSVPCLAMLGGVAFLGESLTIRMSVSTLAVLAGILLVTRAPKL